MNSHEMNISILFPFELFPTQVTGTVYVEFRVGIELILFGKCPFTSFFETLEISAVFSSQMPPECSQGKHDWDVAQVTRIFWRLFLLFLSRNSLVTRFTICRLRVGFLMMSLIVISQILFILEHLVAILTLEGVIILMSLFMSFSVRDGIKNYPTVRAPVSHPLMGGKMGEFMLVQLSIKSEGPATDVTIKFVWIFTVLSPLMLHAATIGGKSGATLPPAGVRFDSCVGVQVTLHMTVKKKSFSTHVTRVSHVTCMTSEMFLQEVLFSILPLTPREVTFVS